MADKATYFYMRLKENYFDNDKQKLLESMQNGYLYSNILLKLYLKSLRDNGRLMFSEKIPYDEKMLAIVTGHKVQTVRKALQLFEELDLIEKLDSGEIFMLDIQNYVGKSSDEADRKRSYRDEINRRKNQAPGHLSDDCPDIPDAERETHSYSHPKPEAEDRIDSARSATADSLRDDLIAYAKMNISEFSPQNAKDLQEFQAAGISPDAIRHAIDEACAAGKNEGWGYTHQILVRYLQAGIRTLNDCQADQKAFESQKRGKVEEKPKPAFETSDVKWW